MRVFFSTAFLSVVAAAALLMGCARSGSLVQVEPAAVEPVSVEETQRPQSRKEVIQSILPSNVRVAVLDGDAAISLATGVVVHVEEVDGSPTSWVMTNAHVAVNAEGVGRTMQVLVGPEGGETRYPATVVAIGDAPEDDLAVLKVEGFAGQAAALADDEIEVGEDVVAVGAPYGRGLSVSTGIVSQVGRTEDGGWTFKTDAPIGYGASGGGVYRVSDGRLIALVEGYRTAKVSFPIEENRFSFDVPMPGETFAAPAGQIRAFLEAEGLAALAPADTRALSQR